MSITSRKKTIIIHNFNFYEKTLIQLKKFNKKKRPNYIIFLKIEIKLKLKKTRGPT